MSSVVVVVVVVAGRDARTASRARPSTGQSQAWAAAPKPTPAAHSSPLDRVKATVSVTSVCDLESGDVLRLYCTHSIQNRRNHRERRVASPWMLLFFFPSPHAFRMTELPHMGTGARPWMPFCVKSMNRNMTTTWSS